jgi:hypothetical protein
MGPLIGYWCEMAGSPPTEVAEQSRHGARSRRRRATRMRQALEQIAARLADRGSTSS